MRLIDADALKSEISWYNHHECVDISVSGVMKDINNTPTIDPEDCRPHGRWVETNWAEYDGYGEVITFSDVKALKCTNCCNCFKKELLWRKNYCPNCGAKMDEMEQGE